MNGVIAVERPARQTAPLVFSSPHSGSAYDPTFIAESPLDEKSLRRSEDSFVDEIFEHAPTHGAPLLRALFPRAYLDPNREPYELDPDMFLDPLPDHALTRTDRVRAGFGTIARVVASGAEIYRNKLRYAEAERRIKELYNPYHKTLRRLVEETHKEFGMVLLLDCHSMPSIGGPTDRDRGRRRPDFVLGDRYGTSCAPDLTDTVERLLRESGYSVVRNDPYAGAFTITHYGQPDRGVHALQIEVSRGLYMDEDDYRRSTGLPVLQTKIGGVIAGLAAAVRARPRAGG